MNTALTHQRRSPRRSGDVIVLHTIGYFFVIVFSLMCLLPFLLIITSSLNSESSIIRNGYSFTINDFSLAAYKLAFKSPQKILWAYRNTIGATVIGTTGAVLLASMTGFVLQRKDFTWRNGFSFFFFFTMLFNGGLVPWYILCVRYLGLKNNYLALILPMLFSVWNMIIAKSFIRGIPFEITESVMVDGGNDITIFFRIILPMSKPLLATIGLFTALSYWNDWYNSMLFINKDNLKSLQYFLNELLGSIQAMKLLATYDNPSALQGVTLPQESLKMAMTIITTGPILFLYPFVQKYFIKGLTIGAVKG